MLGYIGSYENQLESFIESMSEQLDLIYIRTKPSSISNRAFNIFPSLDLVCTAFADLIILFEWKHAAIFYNLETSK